MLMSRTWRGQRIERIHVGIGTSLSEPTCEKTCTHDDFSVRKIVISNAFFS